MKPVQAAGGQSPVHAPQPRGACSRQAHVLARMRELEVKNTRLKRMYANLALKNAAIKGVLGKILTLSAKRQVVAAMVTEHRLSQQRAGLAAARRAERLRGLSYRPGWACHRAARAKAPCSHRA